jgi:hypothetical protein
MWEVLFEYAVSRSGDWLVTADDIEHIGFEARAEPKIYKAAISTWTR